MQRVTRVVTGLVLLQMSTIVSPVHSVHAEGAPCSSIVDAYQSDDAMLRACGYSKWPLQAESRLTRGGTQYVYRVGNQTWTFRIPPSDFDPRSASADELAYYNLPPRPNQESELQRWEQSVSNNHYSVPGPYLITNPHQVLPPRSAGGSTSRT
jgi:hypothetical protein